MHYHHPHPYGNQDHSDLHTVDLPDLPISCFHGNMSIYIYNYIFTYIHIYRHTISFLKSNIGAEQMPSQNENSSSNSHFSGPSMNSLNATSSTCTASLNSLIVCKSSDVNMRYQSVAVASWCAGQVQQKPVAKADIFCV